MDEILIIRYRDELYGISTDVVQSIARVTPTTPIPLAPFQVRGVTSRDGGVVTVFDFASILLNQTRYIDDTLDKSRHIVMQIGNRLDVLLVEEVIKSFILEGDIEPVDDDSAVMGIYKYGEQLIQIIDHEAFFAGIAMLSYDLKPITSYDEPQQIEKQQGNISRYLFFTMGSEFFAIDVDFTREIIARPEELTPMVGVASQINGMMTLREEMLVIIDLRRHYNIAAVDSQKNRVIVTSFHGQSIGLIVDSIIDIKDINTHDIRTMPNNFEDDKIGGILTYDDQLVSVINKSVMKELHGLYEMDGNEKSTAEHHLHPEIVDEVVIFSLRKQEFAFRTERIKEIIDISEITMVVDVDSSVKGVTNVRGQVVPVFALNDRLGLDTSKATDMYRLIICENGDELMGIIVDEVNDIRQIQPHEVEEDDSTTQGVLNVLKLENGKRLAVLLDEVMLLAS